MCIFITIPVGWGNWLVAAPIGVGVGVLMGVLVGVLVGALTGVLTRVLTGVELFMVVLRPHFAVLVVAPLGRQVVFVPVLC